MKTAIISGSSYGLGLSIVNLLLSKNFKVYGISRTEPKIESDNFVWIKADLLNEEDLKNIINHISEEKVDLLINNAGTAILEQSLELSDNTYNSTFGLNFLAPIKLTSLLKKKIQGSLVINVSSNSDRFSENNYGLYSASKAALNIFFDTIALENKNIKIFNVLPSYIDTPLQHKLNGDGKDKDFTWDMVMNSQKVAECILNLFENQNIYPSSSRIMIVSNKLIDDTIDPEKLWYYNIDTAEFKKLK